MRLTDIFKFKLFEGTDKADLEVVNENFEVAEDAMQAHAAGGDHDGRYLKKAEVVNNNTTTAAGYALDARQANPDVAGSLGAQIRSLNSSLAYQVIKKGYQTAYKYNDGRLNIIYDCPVGQAIKLPASNETMLTYVVIDLYLDFAISFTGVPSCICEMAHVGISDSLANVSFDDITANRIGRVLFYKYHTQEVILNATSRIRGEFKGYWF